VPLDELLPLLDGLTASVFVVDGARTIVLLNRAGRELFGNKLTGANFVQAVRNPQCLKAVTKVLAGRKRCQTVITLQNPVRTTYQVTVTRLGAKTADRPDEPRAVISLENISHIYEAEQMRTEFVANVSHELRSPLTALNGFIETLRGPARNDENARQRFLGIMAREAGRMERLIGDLLSLSKVEADAHIRPERPVDLSALLHQVIAVLEPAAKKENLRLNLTIADDFAPFVPGDHDQLHQVFVNLVENAIQYGANGEPVTIALTSHDRAAGIRGPAVRIDITDRGPGIKAEHLPRLTERFYRVDKGRSREKGGTGLGLAIVKHILARHRGHLRVTSEIGKGSTFSVLLPR
jgi:two-component system, OmpR family, phosphate regulon sensor histidine kinase PhoR